METEDASSHSKSAEDDGARVSDVLSWKPALYAALIILAAAPLMYVIVRYTANPHGPIFFTLIFLWYTVKSYFKYLLGQSLD